MNGKAAFKRELIIKNTLGMHVRSARRFVNTVEQFDVEVVVSREGQSVDGTSIMDLLMLGAHKGTQICVEANGTDAESALQAICQLVENGFGEE